MSDPRAKAFTEAGYTDLRAIALDRSDDAKYTASLCGRYVLMTVGQEITVYGLSGTHASRTSRNRRWRTCQDQEDPSAVLRPVSRIVCPRRVIGCSMDTASGSYCVAILMEGRMGMVCNLASESARQQARVGDDLASLRESKSTDYSHTNMEDPPVLENGPRSIYKNICHPDDPPRSVALCPQCRCVAFGCSSGLELH